MEMLLETEKAYLLQSVPWGKSVRIQDSLTLELKTNLKSFDHVRKKLQKHIGNYSLLPLK